MMERRKGTIQRRRVENQLLNQEFKIDERSFDDLLAYISDYVAYINFYTTENVIDGNWRSLIEQDPLIYIIGIVKEPISDLRLDEQDSAVVIPVMLNWYYRIEGWYQQLLHFEELVLADKIRNVLYDVLERKKDLLQAALENQERSSDETSSFASTLQSYTNPDGRGTALDLSEMVHTFRKMVIYIQNFTSAYVKATLFDKDNHLPNNAMYIAFSILVKKIQDQLNTLGQRHLDFYYKEVLKQTPSEGIETKSVVCFDLIPISKGALIPEKTQLSAGKLFGSKKNTLFETVKPLLAVPTVIETVQAFYLNQSPFIKVGTQYPTIANIVKNTFVSKGKPQVVANSSLFGADENSIIDSEITESTTTDIGFMIGSQVLFLEEGRRQITLVYRLEKESAKNSLWRLLHEMEVNQDLPMDIVFNDVFEKAFDIAYTSQKGWVVLDDYYVTFEEATDEFRLKFVLENTAPAVGLLAGESQFDWPMIRVVLSEYAPIYAYSYLKGVRIEELRIDVTVEGMKNLSVYSDVGKLPLTKSFPIFGKHPEVGNHLLIGKSELFKKELDALDIHIEWEQVPEDYGGFETYYQGYSKPFSNSSFLVNISALSNGFWIPQLEHEREVTTLFSTVPARTPEGYESILLSKHRILSLQNLAKYQLNKDFRLRDPLVYDIHANDGFFKLTFSAPQEGFGKDLYKEDYLRIATFNAQNNGREPLPNKPFNPKVKQLTLSYRASDTIYFNNSFDGSSDNLLGAYIHITPFGLQQTVQDSKVFKDTMLSNFEGEGYLYLKLKKVQPDTTITLFFDLESSVASQCETPNNIRIEYKKLDQWVALPKKNVVSDSTDQLSKAGIVELLVPHFSTEFASDEIEFRFVAFHEAFRYPVLKGIYPNAVEVVGIDSEETHIGKKVPAGSIRKLTAKIADVKKLTQPQDSFGGKLPTSPELFYTEVSERLRHKDRALTIWDYEHLILQYFHEVMAVKCTNLNQFFKPQAGKVRLVVLSNQWKHDKHHYFNVNELAIIHEFIRKKANSFIKIHVQNPVVEWLLVTCIVTFEANEQGGYFINALNEELNKYLCPVTHDATTNVEGIGGTVVPRMLKSHLENLSYIQSVQKLEIEHIIKKGIDNYSLKVHKESEEIKPTTPWSMLVPKLRHNIYSSAILEDETITEIESQNFRIGLDYIIADDAEEPQEITFSPDEETPLEAFDETDEEVREEALTTILNFKLNKHSTKQKDSEN
ncbi:conserved hypothetical protein [Tenacibaculum litopenaei]|uniref:hypothetical protein n=1 Tax=Tenacibaculum litopenaei TaxID=396016 RepID=UPI0038958FDD